ncbi:MAG: site-specific integrase [Bacteroidetes bacterium]|nr:site-specific integrase [Bacteroidota bacterium]
MKKPTVTVTLDKRRKKGNDLYPVKIRVSMTRDDNRSYSTGIDLSEDEFEKSFERNPKYKFREIRNSIDLIVKKAEGIIDGLMPFFNYDSFKNKFNQNYEEPQSYEKSTLLFVYNEMAGEMKLREQLGNLHIYKQAVNSILDFSSKKNLYFEEITPSFLIKYEKWMRELGRQTNSVGIITRTLRAMFNYARKKKKYIPMECYPFDNYIPPYERKPKDFLTPAEIRLLYEYSSTSKERITARDYWLACYFCNGAYLSDIANFRYKNIQGDFIIFYREKTKNTLREYRPYIKIYMTTDLKDIIDKIGNQNHAPENFIFPLRNPRLSQEENWNAIRSLNSNMSKLIRKIMKELGINKKISMRKSRHSLANSLKNSGVSTEFIQETLGHADKQTTENYLSEFEDELRASIFEKSISLKKLA